MLCAVLIIEAFGAKQRDLLTLAGGLLKLNTNDQLSGIVPGITLISSF